MKKPKPSKLTKVKPDTRDVRKPEPSCPACGYVVPDHEPGCPEAFSVEGVYKIATRKATQ